MSHLQRWVQDNSADLGMIFLSLILGFHFIVVKDALEIFQPITYNALRFTLAFPAVLALALRNRQLMRFEQQDLRYLFAITIVGLVGYQVLFVLSLNFTTSTNSALLIATMPIWTALISIFRRIMEPRTGLTIGLIVTFVGVAVVILSQGDASFSISRDDIWGSLMALGAAMALGTNAVLSQPLVVRYGGLSNALYKHMFTSLGLVIIAVPDLMTLRPADIPSSIWPNLLYSSFLASLSGFLISNYALGKIGAARTATYNNFWPIVAAISGIIVLGETLTPLLLIGGILTLAGVAIARHYMHSREGQYIPVKTSRA